MGSCPMGGPRRTAHDRSRAPRAGPPSKTAFGGTNHHHGPCEPSLRSFRTGLRRGGAKIPEIRKHPPETGPKTGLKTASTLSAVEPVSAPPKRKLENRRVEFHSGLVAKGAAQAHRFSRHPAEKFG